jgi:ZIP family zinc transporter
MLLLLIAITTFTATILGGFIAFKNRDRLHLVMGFTAGVLLGVVAFDLLPEIFHIAEETATDTVVPMIFFVAGFLGFHILEKLTIIHHLHEGEDDHERDGKIPEVGVVSALALAGHSFLDGAAIGLAFQVNVGVGFAVALAVVAHNFSDGLNTVTLMLAHNNSTKRARRLLLLDAVAPMLGAASTLLFTLTEAQLLLFLSFFAGFLLYIGASNILPQAHAKSPSRLTLAMTILGTVLIFLVTRVDFH